MVFDIICVRGAKEMYDTNMHVLMAIKFFTSICRIRDCLTKLYAKDITPDEKQELDEALQREVISVNLCRHVATLVTFTNQLRL
jgi:hypothetical protein